MVHQLTESEMLDYARYLEEHRTVEHEEYINLAVDRVMEHWEEMRNSGQGSWLSRLSRSTPHYAYLPTMKASVGYVGQVPATPALSSYHTVEVRVFPWMDEKLARYVAREQILEQVQPDVG
jgi:hypothetical protein